MARPRILSDEERRERRKTYTQQHYQENKMKKNEYYLENKSRILDQRREKYNTPSGRFSKYKHRAKTKGIDFTLTKEEFGSFWNKPCIYCASEIETIGLDRIDNSLGYVIDNVAPCCSKCNYIKGTLTVTQLMHQIGLIVTHTSTPNQIKHSTPHRRNRIYSAYKFDAAKRQLSFLITEDEYNDAVSSNCFYCGTIYDIGIDRIDNTIGYVNNNIVSCCSTCNFMKHTQSTDEFLPHIHKMYRHMERHIC